jgi:hypothetical protein
MTEHPEGTHAGTQGESPHEPIGLQNRLKTRWKELPREQRAGVLIAVELVVALLLLLVSDFVVSDEDGAALLLDDEDDGVLDEDDGALLEPDAAEPLGVELELDGLVVDEDEDDPPLALSFFVFRSIEVDEELEPDGAAELGVPAADEDEEPGVLGAAVVPLADDEDDGVLGVVALPLTDDEEEPGAVVEPDGAVVVEDELDERSAARSHAVISVAPSARETATAKVESLIAMGLRGWGIR